MILFFLHQELFIFLVFASLLCEKSRCSWYKFSLSVFVNRFWYRLIKGSIKIPLSFHFFKYIFFRRPVIILIEFLSKKEECRVRWASFVWSWMNKIFTLFQIDYCNWGFYTKVTLLIRYRFKGYVCKSGMPSGRVTCNYIESQYL